MSDRFVREGVSLARDAQEVCLGDLVALASAVYCVFSYQGDRTIFVQAENIEKSERVFLTTAAIPSGSPMRSAKKKCRRRKRR